MAIDPSIALNVKQAQIDNPLDAYAKVAQFKQMQQKNRLADLMFGEKQRALEEGNALRGLLSDQANYDDAGNLRRAALPKIGAVAPGQYGDYQKHIAAQEKAAIESQKTKLETGLKQFETVAQIMSGVKDQASYDLARQEVAAIVGPEAAAKIPPMYDPAVIEQNRIKALSVKDQMEQQWKALNFKLEQEKFGYQQKNDADNRAVTLRGQNLNQSTAIRGQNMTDARAREANEIRRKEAKVGEVQQKVNDANDVLTLLDEIDSILPKATGGYAGVAADTIASAFGKSTEGAKATAQLKALQGALVSKMPKMTGPQSDKDVLLYREMAGQVGDPTIPIAQRQAASETIRKLNEKYAGLPEGGSRKKTSGASRDWTPSGGAKVVDFNDL